MVTPESEIPPAGARPGAESYPLRDTAARLNDQLGLYLSEEQQRGLAAALLIGVAIGAALLAWNVGQAIRRN